MFCFPKILYISNKSQGLNIRAKLQDAYLAKISLLFLGHVNYIKLFLKNLAIMSSCNSMEKLNHEIKYLHRISNLRQSKVIYISSGILYNNLLQEISWPQNGLNATTAYQHCLDFVLKTKIGTSCNSKPGVSAAIGFDLSIESCVEDIGVSLDYCDPTC